MEVEESEAMATEEKRMVIRVSKTAKFYLITMTKSLAKLSYHEEANLNQVARRVVELGEKAMGELNLGHFQGGRHLKLRIAQIVPDIISEGVTSSITKPGEST